MLATGVLIFIFNFMNINEKCMQYINVKGKYRLAIYCWYNIDRIASYRTMS